MKHSLSAFILASALCLPAFAFAATTTSPPATGASSSQDLDRIVCRKSAPVTGSLIPADRVCHTQRQWNQMQADAQRNLELNQSHGLQGALPGH